jgi:hypothetical protein
MLSQFSFREWAGFEPAGLSVARGWYASLFKGSASKRERL